MAKTGEQFFYPTDNKPISFENFSLYETYFTLNNDRYELKNIIKIEYRATSIRVNFLPWFMYEFKLYLRQELKGSSSTNDIKVIDMKSKGDLTKDKITRIQVIHSVIAKETYKQRLFNYFDMVRKNGYFNYPPNIRIYNNGDLYINEKKAGNFIEAYRNELLKHGLSYVGFGSASDPYALTIYHKKRPEILGIDFSKKTTIQLYYDKECIETLITNLTTTGSII